MILLLDIGNHRLKWATAEGGALQGGNAIEHGGDPVAALERVDAAGPGVVWVSHVVGAEVEPALSKAVKDRFACDTRFARTEEECDGLRVAYAEPQRLGVDRWLGMFALWQGLRAPFVVVNSGTALTFDAVDDGGMHLGGLIAPGLVTAQKAVLDATRFAVRPQAAKYAAGLGKDTESCVRQGALHACAGAIERATRGAAGAHFITGGDAPSLLPHLGRDWQWRPQLVLEGLLALAQLEGAA